MSEDTNPLRGSRVALILIGVLLIVIASALLTPQPVEQGREGDQRLSSRLAGAQGARLLYELTDRLGWSVLQRDSAALPVDGRGRTIHAVLSPTMPMTARETHHLLERVRGGDALLYVLTSEAGSMEDSLRVRTAASGSLVVPAPVLRGARECGKGRDGAVPLWWDWEAELFQLRWRGPQPPGLTVFARVRTVELRRRRSTGGTLPATAAGFPYGKGRIVLVADPDLLRNDVVRVCAYRADLVAVRALEYLSRRDAGAPQRDLIVFDEYHHGFGTRPGTFRAIALYLSRTPSGHLLAQLVAAGLLWLLAAGPRTLVPPDPVRVERRSPLEHVGALAVAYEQVNATRTVTSRLVRGLRHRVQHASRVARTHSDDDFLSFVTTRSPARAGDVALVRRALATPIPRREFAAVGEAIHRIESSLVTTIR